MRVLFALVALLMTVTVTVSAQGWSGPNFYIVNATTDFTAYNFLIDGVVVTDPAFNLTVGTTYNFILNRSMPIHPFGFSTSGDETVNPVPLVSLSSLQSNAMLSGACTPRNDANTSWYTTSGSETTNPCIISLTPSNNASGNVLYYRCAIHSAMVNSLTAVGGTSNPTSTSAPTTTSAPTATLPPTNSTPTPTTPPQGGDAACIVPGAIAVIAVAINALFSA